MAKKITKEWLEWAAACQALEKEAADAKSFSGDELRAIKKYNVLSGQEPTMYEGEDNGKHGNDNPNGDSTVL